MEKTTLGIIILLTVFSMLAVVSAQNYQGCGMMSGLYGGYGSGFAILSWITYILFIALLIAGIYWLIKSANRKK